MRKGWAVKQNENGNEKSDQSGGNEDVREKPARAGMETIDAWTRISSECLNAADELKGIKRRIGLRGCP